MRCKEGRTELTSDGGGDESGAREKDVSCMLSNTHSHTHLRTG